MSGKGNGDIEEEKDICLANKPSDHIPNSFPDAFSPGGTGPYLKKSIYGNAEWKTNEEYGNTPGRKFPEYHEE